jgi:hypothetical protein
MGDADMYCKLSCLQVRWQRCLPLVAFHIDTPTNNMANSTSFELLAQCIDLNEA